MKYSRRSTSKRVRDDDECGERRKPLKSRHIFCKGDDATVACKICLRNIVVSASTVLYQCSTCSDVFHDKCIHKWLRTADGCPNCRAELDEDGGDVQFDVFDSDDEDYRPKPEPRFVAR